MPTRPFARELVLLVVAAIVLRVGVPRAQEPAGAPQQPTFRAGIDSVSVDVIVTDKQGKPVTDLAKEDFDIRESGKPQTVETFKFVKIDDSIDEQLEGREILSFDDQRRETAREESRLFVVFLDDYHVRRGNSMAARERLAQFVVQLSPHDLVAVVTPLSIMAGLTFSRSHISTASAIRDFEGRKYDYTPRNAIEQRQELQSPEAQEQFRNDLVSAALRNLCEQLGSMRDGRKTILYVSEGMTGSIPAGVRTKGTLVPGRPGGSAPLPNQDSREFFDSSSLLNQMQQVFTAANRNNVAIYTIDPRGLGNFEYGVEEDVTSAADRRILNEAVDFMRVLASETDGRAIVNRNDPMPALKQMVTDGSTYYLLSYTSSLAPRDGKFHEIQVRVKRPNVEVRARKGYWAYTADDVARASAPPRASAPEEVTTALDELSTIADGGRARLVNTWVGAARSASEKTAITFVWEAATTTPGNPADTVERVSVIANAITGEELFHGSVPRETALGRSGGQVTFDAPAGTVRIRLTPEDARGTRLDSDEATITVPDLTGTGPQITTPFVYRGRTARDLQQVRAGGTAVPVVRRVFSRTERLLVRFGVYGPGGTTPAVTLRLLNQGGTVMASLPPPTAVANAAATLETEVSLASFPPGDYLLEITADSAGETAKQLVAIRVTG
ncbi:MAG: VWA domain-containing protein [Vicinamibacterales bacterium]